MSSLFCEIHDCCLLLNAVPGLWTPWSPWSLCTVTCGGGMRNRNRTCDTQSFGNLTAPCEGETDEENNCHTFECLPLGKLQNITLVLIIRK